MKKVLCLMLAVIMTVAMFSGCGEKKGANNALYNPDIKIGDTGGLEMPLSETAEEISWLLTSTVDGLNDSYVIKKIREITGVNLQVEAVSPSGATEKYNTLVAAKTLPDISAPVSTQLAEDLCMQGAYAAIEDYMDYVPNFKKTFVDDPEKDWVFKSYASADGKLYGYYGWDWNRDINTGVAMYRKDIFDKNNIEMWDSPEGLYNALKKLKEIYPDSIPMVQKTGDATFNNFAKMWGLVAHNPYYNEEDKQWYFTDITDEYREVLDFMKKLVDEGLLDQEFLTRTQADWTSIMTQPEKAFVTIDWIGRMSMFKEQSKETVPDFDLRFSNPIGPDQKYEEANQLCWARYVASTCKNIPLAFQLLDFILSPAGKELITMGIEGETFTIGEDGMADYIEFPDTIPAINQLEEKYGMFIEQMYLSFDRRSSYFEFTEAEKEAQDYMKDESHVRPMDPILAFNAEEKEANTEIAAALISAGKEFATQYVLGGKNTDADWNAWKEKAKSLGADKLIANSMAAQKRYDAE